VSRVFRAFGVVFLVVTLVAAYTFFTSDDAAIEANARSTACAGRGPKCHAALERFLKTPFFQDRQFRVGGATVSVRCTRAGYLFGELRCAVK
jgi:hypothetical protein